MVFLANVSLESGGSVLTELISGRHEALKGSKVVALVRSQEQADIISKLDGVAVHQADISNEKAMKDLIKKQESEYSDCL